MEFVDLLILTSMEIKGEAILQKKSLDVFGVCCWSKGFISMEKAAYENKKLFLNWNWILREN